MNRALIIYVILSYYDLLVFTLVEKVSSSRPPVSSIRANINKNGQQTMPYGKGKGTL
jgi:hypothetical protein